MSNKRNILPVGIMASFLVMTACTPNDIDLGGAARHDYALQVIDPEPDYEGGQPAADGSKAAAAAERYRTDKVKQPVSMKTTTRIEGSSGGSSGPN